MELIISARDYNTIKSLIEQMEIRHQIKESHQLREEIKKMKIITDVDILKTIVGLNSEVIIHDMVSSKKVNFKITLPTMANIKEKKISILAPISIALLGFKSGDQIEWKMPGGIKKIKIIDVKNS